MKGEIMDEKKEAKNPPIDLTEYWKDRDENGVIENLDPWWSGARSDW